MWGAKTVRWDGSGRCDYIGDQPGKIIPLADIAHPPALLRAFPKFTVLLFLCPGKCFFSTEKGHGLVVLRALKLYRDTQIRNGDVEVLAAEPV